MNKRELIATLRSKRAEWDDLLKQFPTHAWTKAGADGSHSLKDVVAHVNWYERQTVGMLLAQAMVGSKLWDLNLEQRNASIYAENKDRPLEAIQADALRIFPSLIAAIEGLSDADLDDPRAFTDWPESWIPWQVVASNTYEHYQQHIPGIQAWLKITQAER
jgi:hypothetical protein